MSDGYMTAQELGIKEIEREALIHTIEVLRAESLIFDMSVPCSRAAGKEDRSFRVGRIDVPVSPCGTHACIGGTMSLLMQNGMKLPDEVTPEMARESERYVSGLRRILKREDSYSESLHELFYGRLDVSDPEMGIKAIGRFLSGNIEDPWRKDDNDE